VTRLFSLAFVLIVAANLAAESPKPANPQNRRAAEYYAAMYARHYRVPVSLVRAIIERESNWRACAVSPKGARGLMQLMPATARRLGMKDSCNINQNISGGVRYLAWLMRLFHNDLRLVAAGYYAGEDIVARRGPVRGKRGKPKAGFPPFPPPLGIAHNPRDSHFSHSPDCCWFLYEPNN